MEREIFSLNGKWDFIRDPENVGMKEGWPGNNELEYEHEIEVPSTWNVIEPEYEGVAFYRKRFIIDKD